MAIRSLATAVVLSSFLAAPGATGPTTAERDASLAMFERLKTLAGQWRGSVEWSGARTGSGPLAARYSLTGNGTAVVEDLEMDGKVTMTSIYHLDGHDLRLTHYCGTGNQPRLKASTIDGQSGLLRFSFVDITNLKTLESGHVNAVELRLDSERKITLTFTFVAKNEESYERVALTRVQDAAPRPD